MTQITHSHAFAIALDMDGVIFRTVKLKHDALLSLFPAHLSAVASRMIWSLAGVPRRHKLALVHEACHGTQATTANVEVYLSQYAALLEAALAAPPLTPGVASFVALGQHRAFVCSSAPIEEVRRLLKAADLSDALEAVYGAPTSKPDALREIIDRVAGMPLVFFGDAVADREAATQNAVAFVGMTGEHDAFDLTPVPKLVDFSDVQTVLDAVAKAMLVLETRPGPTR